MTPKQYTTAMSSNPLWKLMNPDNYRRGQEIRAEQNFDDDVDGDDFETHARREKFQPRELV